MVTRVSANVGVGLLLVHSSATSWLLTSLAMFRLATGGDLNTAMHGMVMMMCEVLWNKGQMQCMGGSAK